MTEEAYAVIARYYDLDFGSIQDDVGLYQEFARRLRAPVLELGVGTGRVAVPLAQAGFTVVGIDSSAAMLAVARRKLDATLAQRLHLVEADMRDFHLNQQFGLVFCPLSTFRHLLTAEDQHRALTCAAKHLAADGLLVLDLPATDPSEWEAGARGLVLDWVRTHPETGHTVYKFVSERADRAQQLQHLTLIYDEVDETATVHRHAASFTLRNVMRREMELLLAQAGLRLEGLYGSYDLDAYGPDSQRMIFVVSKMLRKR